MLVLGFADYEAQARRLAQALSVAFRRVELHRFPDGESRVTLPTELSDHVVLCRSLNQPNDKLIELLLTAETARQAGVQRLTLVAPYLCYMRQDIPFHPGEAVSQRLVGRFLANLFDGVISIDAHLHRIARLDQVFPGIPAINRSAAPLLSQFLLQQAGQEHSLLVGPDRESAQWVEAIAQRAERDFIVATKRRLSDHRVEIRLPEQSYEDKKILLIDDMISTGNTLCQIAGELRAQGALSIDAIVTHALFDKQAEASMKQAGIENIWSTDSVSHPSNILYLDQLLAEALGDLDR
jgi:ribose-phosphate pyrophosphokinase